MSEKDIQFWQGFDTAVDIITTQLTRSLEDQELANYLAEEINDTIEYYKKDK